MTVPVWLIYLGLFLDRVVGWLCLETSHLSTHSSHLASYHTLNVLPKWCVLLRKTKADGDGNQMSIKIFFCGANNLLHEKNSPKTVYLLEIYLYCIKWMCLSSIPLPKQTGVFYTGVALCCVISQTHPVAIPFSHSAGLAQPTWKHRMSSWRVHDPRTSKISFQECWAAASPQHRHWGVRACSVPEKRATCHSSL